MKIQKSEKKSAKAKKRGRGRPKKAPSEKVRRENRLTVMCWPDERAALDKAAGDQDTSTWLRELGLRAAGYEEG